MGLGSLSPWRERARVRGIWIGDGENLYGPAYVLTIILDFRRVCLVKEVAGYKERLTVSEGLGETYPVKHLGCQPCQSSP